MIEQSLLCKVLDAPDLEILHSNGVVEEMFLTCKDEIHFIIEHYNSYLTYAGVGILLVCVAFIVYNACKRRENKTQRQK